MFTNSVRFTLEYGIVHSRNTTTGDCVVRIPALLGKDTMVYLDREGLVKNESDEWVLPHISDVVFVAASHDLHKFLLVSPPKNYVDPMEYEALKARVAVLEGIVL
jgi:hypothetical protein